MISDYLEDIAQEMRHKSDVIRRDFARHRPSAGDNREDLVEKFLIDHLPKRLGTSTGLVISHDGEFSSQADLLVVDNQNNVPFHPQSPKKVWPIEAVYALIEVKTHLNPSDLVDAVSKGRKFKRLPRQYCDTGTPPRIKESLFVIWSFDSPSPKTFKKNLIETIDNVPCDEQPDLIIVPDRLVAKSGSYQKLSKVEQPGSPLRQDLQSQGNDDPSSFLVDPMEIYALGENSLFAWYIWFDSWLRQAGPRFVDPINYIPPNKIFGTKI